MPDTRTRSLPRWICLLLAGLTFAVYAPVSQHEFIHYDDPAYVTANPQIQSGLTRDGLAWAFGRLHGRDTYWHPLTWVSHMVDCQLFGLNAGAHHLVNVVFHALNAVLLFLVLLRMTGATWRSVVVAALFIVHPLQVDTVAWVAERKNVLSGCFWWLTLLAYARYAERGGTGRYLLALGLFGLGLMAKPTLVTLPCVLLLLDFWPLRRFQFRTGTPGAVRNSAAPSPTFLPLPMSRLILEKVPFLGLSLISSAITVWAHQGLAVTQAPLGLALSLRLENAVVSYARYLGKLLWPSDLAVLYPHPVTWVPSAVGTSAILLLGISGVVLWKVRQRPALAVGWLWFLGTLLPTIGLVEAGIQAMADRFVYLPIVGLLVMAVWGVADLSVRRKRRQIVLTGLCVLALVGCVVRTAEQLPYWQNSVALFEHATGVTRNNFAMHYNLGVVLLAGGREPEAVREVQAALRANPQLAEGHQFLGNLAAQHQRFEEAIGHYQTANTISPGWPLPLECLARAEVALGRLDEAMATYRRLAELTPENPEAHVQLGSLSVAQQQPAEALKHWREALRLKPDYPELLNNLAWFLATHPDATLRDGAEAVRHGERACELTQYRRAVLVGTLAAAYAEAGRFPDAVVMAQKAQELALAEGDQNLTARNADLLEVYRAGRAYHEEAVRR
jgi:tetratricopeptide (TPR) repeat protein